MKKMLLISLLMTCLSCAHSGTSVTKPKLTEQYVMLYYEDLTATADFYGKLLGLKTVMDAEWVKLYEVIPGSFIGTVKSGGDGAFHKAKPDNAVMVSIVTEDIDTWYEIVKSSGQVAIVKDVADSKNVPIRGFLVRDPGGYTVEFFQWLNK